MEQYPKSWYLPDTINYRKRFGLEEKLPGSTSLPDRARDTPAVQTVLVPAIERKPVLTEHVIATCNADVLP